MSWAHQNETHFHEACFLPVFADGAVGIGGSAMRDGVAVEVIKNGTHGAPDTVRPEVETVGWIFECDCVRIDPTDPYARESTSKWRDPQTWTRVPSPALEDLAQHRVWVPDEDLCGVDMDTPLARAAREVWVREHLDPLDVDDEIRSAVADRRAAEERLDAAVAKARQLGRSWAKVGAAAGMTAQSANERWRNRV
jgi:hypothetical protein